MSATTADIIPHDWARWSGIRPELIGQLSGGLTNRNYLLATGKERLVLRLNSDISTELDLDREAEASALHLADRAGLCAPVVHCDPARQYLVTRYLEGQAWCPDDEGALQKLADLLRKIHALPPIDAHLDIQGKVARYRESIDDRTEFGAELHVLHRHLEPHIERARSLSDGAVLCHNDLVPANLVVTGPDRLFAIDWEYAAMVDPFYDLAVIAEEHTLDERRCRLLLAEYLGCENVDNELQRLSHWRLIYRYLAVLWHAVQWSMGRHGTASVGEILGWARNLSRAASLSGGAGRR
ncbi:choline/ethanolamine kinase family protein [Microbulbifer yueqingensis]|uniref:Thiamine kinase n=1 Tax=Microbulbifer yueqingensis TaxID=658219 RepID=A0A1G9BGA8_9GAMM|nr:choline/ethanolamine kinase family protein [Microbulbifer yueqingensis]SDK38230.1 thiamine kinase [Microbulbifer yueqingensis]